MQNLQNYAESTFFILVSYVVLPPNFFHYIYSLEEKNVVWKFQELTYILFTT